MPASTEITPITYRHSQRIISTKIVSLLPAFDRNYGEGIQLKHDWGVFAAAWRQGASYGQIRFHVDGGYTVEPLETRANQAQLYPTDTTIGDVVLMYDSTDEQSFKNCYHFMVHASLDNEQEPLYASKLGVLGRAVLATVSQVARLYRPKEYAINPQLLVIEY